MQAAPLGSDQSDLLMATAPNFRAFPPAEHHISFDGGRVLDIDIKLQRASNKVARHFQQTAADAAKAPVFIDKYMRDVGLALFERQKAHHAGTLLSGYECDIGGQALSQTDDLVPFRPSPRKGFQAISKDHLNARIVFASPVTNRPSGAGMGHKAHIDSVIKSCGEGKTLIGKG